jgi:hypothetical protein
MYEVHASIPYEDADITEDLQLHAVFCEIRSLGWGKWHLNWP